MAAMTGRPRRVTPAPETALPGDRPVTVDPGQSPDTAGKPATRSRSASPRVTPLGPPGRDGRQRVEVVVDGWRFVLCVEDAARADLRERARRDQGTGAGSGAPIEIRAIIPGRIASVAVTAGDTVAAGQALVVVEAMKMQNELRAPRAGTVQRVATAAGSTVEIGELLVVLG